MNVFPACRLLAGGWWESPHTLPPPEHELWGEVAELLACFQPGEYKLFSSLSLSTQIECKACYHKACFKSGSCPRCERLQARRELLTKQSLESYLSDYEEEPTEALALEATVLETT